MVSTIVWYNGWASNCGSFCVIRLGVLPTQSLLHIWSVFYRLLDNLVCTICSYILGRRRPAMLCWWWCGYVLMSLQVSPKLIDFYYLYRKLLLFWWFFLKSLDHLILNFSFTKLYRMKWWIFSPLCKKENIFITKVKYINSLSTLKVFDLLRNLPFWIKPT